MEHIITHTQNGKRIHLLGKSGCLWGRRLHMDARKVHSGVKILALQPAKHYISTYIALIIHTVCF